MKLARKIVALLNSYGKNTGLHGTKTKGDHYLIALCFQALRS